ncbi:MAG: hypothetical protein PHE78_01715 [Candidatus Gastranaerophilales bacterium]|nr:hypothetical protein [Candidatus Gastranaerophilales bacterium]
MFKNGQKVIYKQRKTYYGPNPIPHGTKGIIIKVIEDEMLVDFLEYGKAIVVPSCLKLDE